MTEAKRKKIISVLITTPTRAEACKLLGITERTLYNYMQDESFKAEYNHVLDCVINDTEARITEARLNSINHLVSVIDDPEIDDLIKIKADRLILEHYASMKRIEAAEWS